MPRAVSDKFHRLHSAAVKRPSSSSKDGGNGNEGGGNGVKNPLFNTEKYGQHILKNPKVAQMYVFLTFFRLQS